MRPAVARRARPLAVGSALLAGAIGIGVLGVHRVGAPAGATRTVPCDLGTTVLDPAQQPVAVPRRGGAGSPPVGGARYRVPPWASYVSPSGSDAGPGSATRPWRTLAHAVASAGSGATIVLRAGTYHESVTIPKGKPLTVQACSDEPVWMDGSVPVTRWQREGTTWRSDGWTAVFDHSPTYDKGAPDNTEPGWSFINSANPMAAYPDQVWVDGVAQRQVGDASQLAPGAFLVDAGQRRLYLGQDPTGHEVRASTLGTAITVLGEGSIVRGLGVRRYATALPEKGAVRSLAPRVTLQDLLVTQNATQGVYVGGKNGGSDNTLRQVTLDGNGMVGLESSYADGLVLSGVRAVHNNQEHFNQAPVSGGAKITRARGVTVTGSVFNDNEGPGLWLDESVYNAKVLASDFVRNTASGAVYEISAVGIFADDLFSANGGSGLKVNNSSEVSVYNNTSAGNAKKALWLVQDRRLATDLSVPGHDPRQELPDPTVPWVLRLITVKNNVFAGGQSACLVCIEDDPLQRKAVRIGVTVDGNVYSRPAGVGPKWDITWPDAAEDPFVYKTLDAFRAARGQEQHGTQADGPAVVDDQGRPVAPLASGSAPSAQPLDSAVAAALQRPVDADHLGAWLEPAPAQRAG